MKLAGTVSWALWTRYSSLPSGMSALILLDDIDYLRSYSDEVHDDMGGR